MNYSKLDKFNLKHLFCLLINVFIKHFKNIYIYQISEDSPAQYYQNNKEKLQKELLKDIKVFLKKEKEATIWL